MKPVGFSTSNKDKDHRSSTSEYSWSINWQHCQHVINSHKLWCFSACWGIDVSFLSIMPSKVIPISPLLDSRSSPPLPHTPPHCWGRTQQQQSCLWGFQTWTWTIHNTWWNSGLPCWAGRHRRWRRSALLLGPSSVWGWAPGGSWGFSPPSLVQSCWLSTTIQRTEMLKQQRSSSIWSQPYHVHQTWQQTPPGEFRFKAFKRRNPSAHSTCCHQSRCLPGDTVENLSPPGRRCCEEEWWVKLLMGLFKDLKDSSWRTSSTNWEWIFLTQFPHFCDDQESVPFEEVLLRELLKPGTTRFLPTGPFLTLSHSALE